MGVVLLQRLARLQGPSAARNYGLGLGVAMGLFAIYYTFAYRVPLSPLIVLPINLLLFGVLWWSGHKLTAACAVDSESVTSNATG